MSNNITMWRTLCMAACGYRVYVCALTERHAKSAFERCFNTLKRIGLERNVWTAHSSNGNRYIRFKNGGECRFTSREPLHINGVSFEQAVFDEIDMEYVSEEIVRCKNCKFLFENPIFKWFECERPMPCGDQLYILPKVEPDGFCAWGERRDA